MQVMSSNTVSKTTEVLCAKVWIPEHLVSDNDLQFVSV